MTTTAIIRQYCASKGFSATRLSAREAIRQQLAYENDGFFHPDIMASTQVDVRLLDLSCITIYNEPHYHAVQPRPVVGDDGVPLIAGVVFDHSGRYRLIDGYHRLKWLHDKGVGQATYIVLSNP